MRDESPRRNARPHRHILRIEQRRLGTLRHCAAASTLPRSMLAFLARLAKRLAACGSGLMGVVAFRLGRQETARRAFERVLHLGGDEFTAYVHLGRIALGNGDFAGYRREMNNARNIDPERFARMRPGPDGIEARFVGSPFEETGERATWRSVRPGSQGMARRSTVRSAEMPTESSDDLLMFGPIYEIPQMEVGDPAPRARDGRDDFLSTTERDRFRNLPPLRRDDVRTADFDELARKLGG